MRGLQVRCVMTRLAQLMSCRAVLEQAQAHQPQRDRQPHGCTWAAGHKPSPARHPLNPGTSALSRAVLRDELLSLFCSPIYPEHIWAAFADKVQPWDEKEAERRAFGTHSPAYASGLPPLQPMQQQAGPGVCGAELQEGQLSTGGCPSGVAADPGGAGGGLPSNSSTCCSLGGMQEEQQPRAELRDDVAEAVAEEGAEVVDEANGRFCPAPAETAMEACAAERGTEGRDHGARDGVEGDGGPVAAVASSSRGLEGQCNDRSGGPGVQEGASAGYGGCLSEEDCGARKRRRIGSGAAARRCAGGGAPAAGQVAGHVSGLPIAGDAAAAAGAPARASPLTGARQGRTGSREGAGRGLQNLDDGPQAGGRACGPSVSEAVPGPLQHDVDPQLPSLPSVPTLPSPRALDSSANDAQPSSVPSSPYSQPSPEPQTRPPPSSATPHGPRASAPDSQPSTVQRCRLRPAAPSPYPTPPATSTSMPLPSFAVRSLPIDMQDEEPHAVHNHQHPHQHQHQHQRDGSLPILSPVEPLYSPPDDVNPAPSPAPPAKHRQLRPLPPAPSIADHRHYKPPAGLHLDGGAGRSSSPRPHDVDAAANGVDECKKDSRRGAQRPPTERLGSTASAGAAKGAAAVAAGEVARATPQPKPPAGPACPPAAARDRDEVQRGVEQAGRTSEPADPRRQQQQQQERAEEDAGQVAEAHRRQARKRSRSRCRNPAPAPEQPPPPRREPPKSLEEWSERVMEELVQRPGCTATLTHLDRCGGQGLTA